MSAESGKKTVFFNSKVFAAVIIASLLFVVPAAGIITRQIRLQRVNAQVSYVKGVIEKNRTGLARAEEDRLARVIVEVSREYDVDPTLILAIIKTESRFNNWATSRRGAAGLMQIMPETGRELAESLEVDWQGRKTLYDPFNNVRMGVHYYSVLKERFDDDMHALAAYNAGPNGAVARARLTGAMARNYATKVMDNYREIKEGAIEY